MTTAARRAIAVLTAVLALLFVGLTAANATGPGHGHDPVTLCHNGHEITVDDDSVVNAHLRHGDTLGTCPAVEPTEEPTVEPTEEPTTEPTEQPTEEPRVEPTPTEEPTTPAPTDTPTEPAATSTPVTPAPAPVVSEVGTVATPATTARVQLAETGVSPGLGFLVATIAVVLGTAALVARRRHTRS